MDIQFDCPRCGQNLSVEEKGAGMLVNCPSCKEQIEIPHSTAPQAPKVAVPSKPQKLQSAVFCVGRSGTELGKFSEQEFRDKILSGEIRPYDDYWTEGMDDWQSVSEYRSLPSPSGPPTLPPLRRTPEKKKRRTETPASIGGACALLAAFLPLLHPSLFFLLSLPLLFAAFVLAIVSLVRGRVTGGICLLIGLFPAFMMAFVVVTERGKILSRQTIETRSTP
jgi:DNA-directed RNA polymerase subunit M/transcription elongation factor TFIIS